MNYLKFLASKEIESLQEVREDLPSRVMNVQSLLAEARSIRNHIVEANTRLIYSLVGDEGSDSATLKFLEVIEKFDYIRGKDLATLATLAIQRDVINRFRVEQKHRTVYSDERLEHHADRSNPDHEEGSLVSNQALVAEVVVLLAKTDKRAAQVISLRYGLGGNKPKTRKEVGAELGLSRGRIGQIQKAALDSLREILMSKGLL